MRSALLIRIKIQELKKSIGLPIARSFVLHKFHDKYYLSKNIGIKWDTLYTYVVEKNSLITTINDAKNSFWKKNCSSVEFSSMSEEKQIKSIKKRSVEICDVKVIYDHMNSHQYWSCRRYVRSGTDLTKYLNVMNTCGI